MSIIVQHLKTMHACMFALARHEDHVLIGTNLYETIV